MLEKAIGWIRSLTEAGLALIALGVVLLLSLALMSLVQ